MKSNDTHPRRRQLTRRMLGAGWLICLSAWLCAVPGEAADFACANGDVTCLIAAIHQANANGQENTISLAAGVYTLAAADNDTDGPTGLPVVTSTLSITGAGADLTIIERAALAPTAFRIFDVASTGVLRLNKVTVRGGTTERSKIALGAGILASGTVMITDSLVTGNQGQLLAGGRSLGGGVAGGHVVVTRSTISHNGGEAGGGVYIAGNGNLTVEHRTIAQNGAGGGGGGIWFRSQGTLTIADSVIKEPAH